MDVENPDLLSSTAASGIFFFPEHPLDRPVVLTEGTSANVETILIVTAGKRVTSSG